MSALKLSSIGIPESIKVDNWRVNKVKSFVLMLFFEINEAKFIENGFLSVISMRSIGISPFSLSFSRISTRFSPSINPFVSLPFPSIAVYL